MRFIDRPADDAFDCAASCSSVAAWKQPLSGEQYQGVRPSTRTFLEISRRNGFRDPARSAGRLRIPRPCSAAMSCQDAHERLRMRRARLAVMAILVDVMDLQLCATLRDAVSTTTPTSARSGASAPVGSVEVGPRVNLEAVTGEAHAPTQGDHVLAFCAGFMPLHRASAAVRVRAPSVIVITRDASKTHTKATRALRRDVRQTVYGDPRRSRRPRSAGLERGAPRHRAGADDGGDRPARKVRRQEALAEVLDGPELVARDRVDAARHLGELRARHVLVVAASALRPHGGEALQGGRRRSSRRNWGTRSGAISAAREGAMTLPLFASLSASPFEQVLVCPARNGGSPSSRGTD